MNNLEKWHAERDTLLQDITNALQPLVARGQALSSDLDTLFTREAPIQSVIDALEKTHAWAGMARRHLDNAKQMIDTMHAEAA